MGIDNPHFVVYTIIIIYGGMGNMKKKEKKISLRKVMFADCDHTDKDRSCLIAFMLSGDNTRFMEFNGASYQQIYRIADEPIDEQVAYEAIAEFYQERGGFRKVEVIDALEAISNYYPLSLREAIISSGSSPLTRRSLGQKHLYTPKSEKDVVKLTHRMSDIKKQYLPKFSENESRTGGSDNLVDVATENGTTIIDIDDRSML